MADVFRLKIITPEKKFFDEDAVMVELTTTEGQIGVYAKHVPTAAVVAPGVLRIHTENGIREAALMNGFITILQTEVTILAEICEWPEEIDEKRAEEARIRAERRLTDGSSETDLMRAEMALKRALVRLEVRGKN